MKPHKSEPQPVVDPTVLFRNTMEAETKPAEEKKVEVPPFTVKNRSRAQKLAKLLYGPLGRCFKVKTYNFQTSRGVAGVDATIGTFERRGPGVAVGTEQGDKRIIIGAGQDFTEALREPIRQYVMGGKTLEETRKRFEAVVGTNFREPLCVPFEFAEAAFAQFKEEIEVENSRRHVAQHRKGR